MPRYKHYNYSQTVLIPIELEKQITPGTPAYAIHKLVEERVNIEVFEKKIKNDETGRPAYTSQSDVENNITCIFERNNIFKKDRVSL